MNKYLDQFNSQNMQWGNRKFIKSLLIVVQFYVSDNYPDTGSNRTKDIIHDRLNNFINYLTYTASTLELGRRLQGYRFKTEIPKKSSVKVKKDPRKSLRLKDKPQERDLVMPLDFMEVFEAAKKLEMQLFQKRKTESFPVCVQIAQLKASLQEYASPALIEQIGILQGILKNKKNPPLPAHVQKIEHYVEGWTLMVTNRMPEHIFNASSEEELTKGIHEIFSNEKMVDELLVDTKKEILSQILFLKKHQFFVTYYTLTDIAEKYNYVDAVYDDLDDKKLLNSKVEKLLYGLLEYIVKIAYKNIDAYKHVLMENPDATVEKVFDSLELAVTTAYYLKPNYRSLRRALDVALSRDRGEWETWKKISLCNAWFDPKPYRTYQPFMKDVYCMKGDKPNEDPAAQLRKKMGENPAPELLTLLQMNKDSSDDEYYQDAQSQMNKDSSCDDESSSESDQEEDQEAEQKVKQEELTLHIADLSLQGSKSKAKV